MSAIRFFLFGKLHIETDSNTIKKIEPRKAEELLVYLLLCRDQSQSREYLADILWGEIAPEQSKAYLRKALWQLQSLLAPHCGEGIILVDGECLQINPHFDIWLDIEVLEKAFKSTQGVSGGDLEEEQAKNICDALELYRGELLEGWYLSWCLYERERLQYLYLALLDKLIDYCEAHSEYEKGLMFGERILHFDNAHERTHRRLMRLHFLSGDRTSALRQYQKCVAHLKQELNVEPAEETHLLYQMIRKGKLEDTLQITETGTAKADKEPLVAVLNHLNAFHKELSRIQSKLTQDMRIIQRTIKDNHH